MRDAALLMRDKEREEAELYSGKVGLIRENYGDFDTDTIVKFTKIPKESIETIMDIIGEHPDWDDMEVAEEYLRNMD